MDKNNEQSTDKKKEYKYGQPGYIIFLIGFLFLAANMFGYMEAELLNTYIDHVLNLELIWVGIMVSSSATMGLIFLFVWGVISDNTRSRFGRRRPYILVGGILMGLGLIAFGYSPDYFWCFIIDVVIIGIFSNMFYAAQRVLVPDLIEIEYRGRVNAITSIMTVFGIVMPVALTLIANDLYTVPNPDPNETGNILTQEGHIFLLAIGGTVIIIAAILGFLFLKDEMPQSELPPKKKFKEELKETFNVDELVKQKEFFKLIIAMTIFMSGVSAVMSYLFNFIFSLGIDSTGLITVLGIAAPFLILTIVILGKYTDKIGRKKVIPPTIIISTVGFILVPFIAQSSNINIILLGFAFALILIGLIGVLVPMNTWSQDLLPEGKKGQFFGIFNIVNTVSQIIGSLTGAAFVTALTGVVPNPIAMIFAIVPVFFIISIPLFLRVQETLPEEYREEGL